MAVLYGIILAFSLQACGGKESQPERAALPGVQTAIEDVVHRSVAEYSPDGEWICYHDNRDGKVDLYLQPSAGGTPQRLTELPGRNFFGTWSPEGRRIAFLSSHLDTVNLWVVEPFAENRPQRQLSTAADSVAGGFISWSPKGDYIAFTAYRDGVRTTHYLPAAGGEPIPLEMKLENLSPFHGRTIGEFNLTWSPNGKELAFNAHWAGNWDIWAASLEDGSVRQLTSHPQDDWDPSWSPDGRWIAFNSDRGQGGWNCDIWIVDAEKGTEHRLTHTATETDHTPRWSADSRSLLFFTQDFGADIMTIPAAGGEPRMLFENAAHTGFDLATDGQKIVLALQNAAGTGLDLHLRHPDSMEQLTTGGIINIGWGHLMRFSPSGNFIVYRSKMDLWTLSLRTGKQRRITSTAGYEFHPEWSPDGKQIVYGLGQNLWLDQATGGDPRQITDLPRFEHSPSWAPDGNRIAFRNSGDDKIWIYSLAEGRVYELDVAASARAWSPAGDEIAFAHVDGGLWKIPAAGGTPTRIAAAIEGVGSIIWPPGDTLYFTSGASADWWTERTELWKIPAAGGAAVRIMDGLDDIRNLQQAPEGTLYFSNSSQRGAIKHLALGQL